MREEEGGREKEEGMGIRLERQKGLALDLKD